MIKNFKGVKFITTDIYDGNFENIKEQIEKYNIDIQFIKTDGCELEGIENDSIDFVVCNYTLCAINSKSGSEVLALNRFREVLKPGGTLYIEEECPLNFASNDMERVWSRKWQILRSVNLLLNELPYNEISPEILKNILKIIGFKDVQYKIDSHKILGENVLKFFNYRLNKILDLLENKNLIDGITSEVRELEKLSEKTGGMEVPIYNIVAIKN